MGKGSARDLIRGRLCRANTYLITTINIVNGSIDGKARKPRTDRGVPAWCSPSGRRLRLW